MLTFGEGEKIGKKTLEKSPVTHRRGIQQRTNKADCTSVHVQDSQIEPNSTPHWLEAVVSMTVSYLYPIVE